MYLRPRRLAKFPPVAALPCSTYRGRSYTNTRSVPRVLGRTATPLLAASEADREGYVPNVVYTCGALRHGNSIFMPYGVADSAVAFAFMRIPDLLALLS